MEMKKEQNQGLSQPGTPVATSRYQHSSSRNTLLAASDWDAALVYAIGVYRQGCMLIMQWQCLAGGMKQCPQLRFRQEPL